MVSSLKVTMKGPTMPPIVLAYLTIIGLILLGWVIEGYLEADDEVRDNNPRRIP